MFARLIFESEIMSPQLRVMRIIMMLAPFFLCIGFPSPGMGQDGDDDAERFSAILSLDPVGYWPVDDGKGEIVRDISTNKNHGKLRHIPWKGSLADFTSAYQWIEIPGISEYTSNTLSVGGWVFVRGEIFGGNWHPKWGPHKGGFLLIGNKGWHATSGIQVCIRAQGLVEVLSQGTEDALESREAKISIDSQQWQHVVYTYDGDKGSLYINGKLAHSKSGVRYKGVKAPLQIGNDAYWWHQADRSGALDGSVGDMFFFDRELSAEDVRKIFDNTRPAVNPEMPEPAKKDLDVAAISWNDLPSMPPEELSTALETIGKLSSEQINTLSLPAILLGSFNDSGSPEGKVFSALALARLKNNAKDAVPALSKAIEDILVKEGVRIPRVNDTLRNAIIRALLDIAPSDENVRELLGRAYAKPFLDAVDTSQAQWGKVRELINDERYMDALDAFRESRPDSYGERYFTHRTWDNRDYTASATFKGSTYKVGEGVAWKGVEAVGKEDFEKVLQSSDTVPGVRDWRPVDFPHLFRVPVIKINPDGKEQRVYLEGENFIFDGSDKKLQGWSIFTDSKGYIHLFGGQHNMPNPDMFIPGSWEKIGISKNRNDNDFPAQLYWVSSQPENIESFEFVGKKNDPRALPANYLNYMVLLQDTNYNSFLYGRIDVAGWQSWGLYFYDADQKSWKEMGGDACDIINDAKAAHPDWGRFLHSSIRGKAPDNPLNKSLAWAWQPAFYNYCRDTWGLKFDKTGRMHAHINIMGLDENGYNRHVRMYAWSDDLGKTFHRADGSRLELPLTANPAPKHNADLKKHFSQEYWNLWGSLLKHAGY